MPNPFETDADVLLNLSDFVDDRKYLFFAPVSTMWNEAWGGRSKVTQAVMADSTVPQLLEGFESGLKKGGAVYGAAASLGRLDLLQCARECGCR